MTPSHAIGSRFFLGAICLVISLACVPPSEASPSDARSGRSASAPERTLGVVDRGIWSDLDPEIQLTLPAVAPERVTATVDPALGVLVLAIDGFPRKVYPIGRPPDSSSPGPGGAATLVVGGRELVLRPGDHAELAPLLTADRLRYLRSPSAGCCAGRQIRPRDADGDGIPDPLDVLLGAKKTALNAAAYTQGYVRITYPGGDVPRTMGVCTDVVIRAVRNAGIDLQKALHDDIRRAPRAYPMVKGRGNPNIDHRRVSTLLPYFKRHWDRRSARLDDPDDPLRPGDVIFMDTLARPGPDHIGILSDRIGDSGLPLVINNWTNGTVTTEMDLLSFVPVLYRFRLPPS